MTPTQITPGFWVTAVRRHAHGLSPCPWIEYPPSYWDYFERQQAALAAKRHT